MHLDCPCSPSAGIHWDFDRICPKILGTARHGGIFGERRYHQDCTATESLLHKDRCSDSLRNEGCVLDRARSPRQCQTDDSQLQSCWWPALGKHGLRRLDRPDGLQSGRIALEAAQQSSQALSFDRNNDTILPAGGKSLTTDYGVTEIKIAIWPRVH
jgi:hypothetical protein